MAENFINRELTWNRPAIFPWPHVWCRFETKTKNGISYRVKIQDVTPDRFEEVLDLFEANYEPDHPLFKLITLTDKDRLSLRQERRKILSRNLSVIVVLDDDTLKPEILASHIIFVLSKEDSPINPPPFVKSSQCNHNERVFREIKKFNHNIKENVDAFALVGGDTCIRALGMFVKREYRGFNLSYHILSNLSNIGQAFGIRGAAISSTSAHTQSAAKRVGFKVYKEINFTEYKDESGDTVFPIEGSSQFMILKFKVE